MKQRLQTHIVTMSYCTFSLQMRIVLRMGMLTCAGLATFASLQDCLRGWLWATLPEACLREVLSSAGQE